MTLKLTQTGLQNTRQWKLHGSCHGRRGYFYTVSHNRVVAFNSSFQPCYERNRRCTEPICHHWSNQTSPFNSQVAEAPATAHAVLEMILRYRLVQQIRKLRHHPGRWRRLLIRTQRHYRSDMPKQANTVEANFTAVIGTVGRRLSTEVSKTRRSLSARTAETSSLSMPKL